MGEKPDIRGYIKGGVNRAHFYEDNLTIQISQKAENKMRWLCQCSDSAKPCPKPCLEGYGKLYNINPSIFFWLRNSRSLPCSLVSE